MEELISVFRMSEVSPKVRASIIIKLGQLINYKYSANVTEPLVVELVKILDHENAILKEAHYIQYMEEYANPTK